MKSLKILKVCLSLCFIGVLIGFSDTADLWHQIRQTRSVTLFGGISAYCLAQVISSIRWQWILDADGIRVPLRKLFGSYMAGMFVNNFLPTSIGGDLVKSYDIYQMTRNSSLAVVSVILERFSGLVVLMVLSWFGIHHAMSLPDQTLWLGWLLLNLLGLIFFRAMTGPKTLDRVVALLRVCRLSRLIDVVKQCHDTAAAYRHRRKLLLKLLVLSVPIQLISISIYKVIASDLSVDLPFSVFLFAVPVITIMALLPISYGGLGVREGVTVYVLSAFNVMAEDALGISIVYLGITYMTSLIGGAFFVLRRSRAGRTVQSDSPEQTPPTGSPRRPS